MINIDNHMVRELRCQKCRAFIVYEKILVGEVVHRCSKCGYLNVFEFKILDVPSTYATIKKYHTISPMKGGE